jgi:hypothetical protein
VEEVTVGERRQRSVRLAGDPVDLSEPQMSHSALRPGPQG